jgi:hypothetical protein
MPVINMLDNNDWQRTCFLVNEDKLPKLDRDHRFTSDARIKYGDTTMGGSMEINPPPQWCRYADIKVSGILAGRPAGIDNPIYSNGFAGENSRGEARSPVGSRGYGRRYSEMMNDNGTFLTLRFGLPKTNPLLNFFGRFYDAEASAVARTGQGTDLFFKGGRILGTIMGYAVAPAIMVGRALYFFAGVQVTKYYYLEPKMHLFWQAANNIANTLAVNRNIIPRVGGRGESKAEIEQRAQEIAAYNRCLPDIFRKEGGIDLMAVSTRYSRLSLRFQHRVNMIATKAESLQGFVGSLANWLVKTNSTGFGGLVDANPMNIEDYISEYLEDEENWVKAQDQDNAVLTAKMQEGNRANYGFSEKVQSTALSVLNDGNQFITYRVNNPGSSTESFSNSAGESAAQGKYNGIVSSARSLRFDAAEFQTGVGLVDSFMSGVKSVAAGIATSLSVDGLSAFMGNAFVDMPQVWQSASASLPRPSFTIHLRSWSGSPMAQFQRIWAIVSMLLAGVLPLSTGPASYTAPLLCEAYCKNICSIKLGMIDSLTLTRAVGNLSRNREGDPMGIDISFSIMDMTSLIAMPISTDIGAINGFAQTVGVAADGIYNTAKGVITGEEGTSRTGQVVAAGAASFVTGDTKVFDDSNPFNDFMAVLGGLSLVEQVYSLQKYRLNLTRQIAAYDSALSVSSTMNQLSGSTPGRLLSAITRGTTVGQ